MTNQKQQAGQQGPQHSRAAFIEGFPASLTPAQCDDIIARFEADDRRMQSRTARGINEKIRTGTMLDIAEYDDWADVRKLVTDAFQKNIELYAKNYRAIAPLVEPGKSWLSPPLLERIDPGQGFDWHIDAGPVGTHNRILSSIIYLTDVAEGGLTEFPYQSLAMKPTKGLMVMFPPFWTHIHRGAPPKSGVKYNITNFLCLAQP